MAWLRESTARQTFGPGLVRVEAAFEVIVFGVAMGGVESGTHRGCCCPGFRAGLMGRAFSDAVAASAWRSAPPFVTPWLISEVQECGRGARIHSGFALERRSRYPKRRCARRAAEKRILSSLGRIGGGRRT